MTTLPRRKTDAALKGFADRIIEISKSMDFKVSSRGWAYQLEGFGDITKAEFDKAQELINECRKRGFLPVDFVAEEEARKFSGVEEPDTEDAATWLRRYIHATMECESYYTPDWWADEEYYIQMVVEKIDIKTLFEPVCKEYHIPLATSKGWSSITQRAEYARRFKEAEADDKSCVLLYFGDHDPDGLRISDTLRKNLEDVTNITWDDGEEGYDPENLEIERFGLNYDFIMANNLTWIDNLLTGSGKDLADPEHANYDQAYVQEYLKKYGARKCEANALVVRPTAGRELCRQAIEKYLGKNALERFKARQTEIMTSFDELRTKSGVQEALQKALQELGGKDGVKA